MITHSFTNTTVKMPLLGVSILSFEPRGYFSRAWLNTVLQIIVDADFNGLQLLPLRTISRQLMSSMPKEYVISYERDWRDHIAGKGDSKYSQFINWLLFGTREHSRHQVTNFALQFPEAVAVDIGETSPIETSPVNLLTREEYLDFAEGVVFDTCHVFELFPTIEEALQFAEDLVKAGKIRLIHLQTRNYFEFHDFINGQHSILYRMMGILIRSEAPIVVELPPWFLWFSAVKKLSKIKIQIEKLVRLAR